MEISELDNWVAILISLFALIAIIWQLKQNQKALNTQTVQSLCSAITDLNVPLSENPEIGLSVKRHPKIGLMRVKKIV